MAIFEGSRYQSAAIEWATDAEGVARPTIYSMISGGVSVARYTTYVTQPGDRYDLLAYQIFGDPQLWWMIANLNPEYLYPDEIPDGTAIRLPRA